jgi:ribosomal protein S18 acetylase RimI-like enzyme
MPSPDIRLLGTDEAPDVFRELARLHSEEIDGGFLTSLGPRVLAILYEGIGSSPDAFIFTASVDGRIVGFLCGSTNTRRVYRHVLREQWLGLVRAAGPKLFNLRNLRLSLETLRYPSKRVPEGLPAAEILNFCVTHHLHRAGIGRNLFVAMTTEFRRRGIGQIRIVTGPTQGSAIQFYQKFGATRVGTIDVHSRTGSELFRYSIPEIVR